MMEGDFNIGPDEPTLGGRIFLWILGTCVSAILISATTALVIHIWKLIL